MFEDEVKEKRVYKTPDTPRFKIARADPHSELMDAETQRKYLSRVSMLLYLAKYSRPDISNSYQRAWMVQQWVLIMRC